MQTKQGSFALLDDLVAQGLLRSTSAARLAYVWRAGAPRLVPSSAAVIPRSRARR
jgi:hypothetical protein